MATSRLPSIVERRVHRYLAQLDRLLPGRVNAFYVVGSVAMDAYIDGRSDVDFVAVVDRVDAAAVRRLRLQFLRSGMEGGAIALRRGCSPMAGTVNGIFVLQRDLQRPVSEILAVAAHSGHTFRTDHGGSDVGPVAWKTLQERGIAVRGPQPADLGLDPEPERLRAWNGENLEEYWRPWAARVAAAPGRAFRARPRWSTEWGAVGPPRLHYTITTGEIASKEDAAEYALDVFDRRWQSLLLDALAYLRRQPDCLRWSSERRGRETAAFVVEVVESGLERLREMGFRAAAGGQ